MLLFLLGNTVFGLLLGGSLNNALHEDEEHKKISGVWFSILYVCAISINTLLWINTPFKIF
jgi:hypothetical protein